MTVKCIDISHWQKGFDLVEFAAGGGLAAIFKATEGHTLVDECYEDFVVSAMALDLPYASYHFMRPGDMREQARFFLEVVQPEDGERVVADYEDDRLDISELVEFLKEIQYINPTLQLTVYSGHLIKEQLGSTRHDWLANNTSLWIAHYTQSAAPKWPTATWPTWSLWQYSDREYVDGFSGPIDGDRFNGSDEQMLKWFRPPPDAAIA